MTFRKQVAWVMVVVALLVLAVLSVARAAPPEIPEERPAAAIYAYSFNTAAITSDTNSSSVLSQAYAYIDLFITTNISDTQTITVTYQVSPDNSNWYDSYEFAAQSSDTVVFTRTICYGRYSRVNIDLNSANTVTPTIKGTFSNNWMPYQSSALVGSNNWGE